MLAFRVRLNGKKLATTGIDGPHVLSAILASVVRRKEDRRTRKSPSRFTTKELDIDLGGLMTHPDGSKESVLWAHRRLKIGDTVTIRIVDADRVDEPVVSGNSSPSLTQPCDDRS